VNKNAICASELDMLKRNGKLGISLFIFIKWNVIKDPKVIMMNTSLDIDKILDNSIKVP